jgi:hypothetical protein
MFMKPRLRFSRNVWDCGIPGTAYPTAYGFGYSPQTAYYDWMTQFNRYRLFGGGK